MKHKYCPAIPTDLRHGCLCVTFHKTKHNCVNMPCLTAVLAHYSHKQVCTYLATHNFLYNPSCCMKLIYLPKADRNRYKSRYKMWIMSNLDCQIILQTKISNLNKVIKWKKCKGPCGFHTTHSNDMSRQQATEWCRWWVLTGGGSPRWADESTPPPGQTQANQEALCPTPPARVTKQIQHCATSSRISGVLAFTSQQMILHTGRLSQLAYLQ